MATFKDALAYMRQVGMYKGTLRNYATGAVCALGACTDLNVGNTRLLDDVAEELYPDRVTQTDSPMGLRSIAQLNDHPDTTIDDIEVVFEKAQLRLDEQV